MEKLTWILAVVDRVEDAACVVDKAVAVARSFGAQVDLTLTDATGLRAVTTLCAERGYHEVSLNSVHRGAEALNEIILRRLVSRPADLVIKAAAQTSNEGSAVGSDDWSLANECPAPVLIVRPRPWAKSTRFAVAVDVLDEDRLRLSRATLHTAGFLALGTRGNLDVLYSERELIDEALRMERAVKVARLVREFYVGCERLQMFSGQPAERLPGLIAARQYDVVVLGLDDENPDSGDETAATARKFAAATQGDLVLVHAATDAEERIAAWRRHSGCNESLHEAQ